VGGLRRRKAWGAEKKGMPMPEVLLGRREGAMGTETHDLS